MDTGGKRQALKSASTDLETADVVLGQVLKVTDLPKGSTRAEADKLFTQFAMSGAKIRWLKDAQGLPGDGWGQWGLGGGAQQRDCTQTSLLCSPAPWWPRMPPSASTTL